MANYQYQHLNLAPTDAAHMHSSASPPTTPGWPVAEKPDQMRTTEPSTPDWSMVDKPDPEVSAAKRKARSSKGPIWGALLTGSLIVIAVMGMGLALVAYLCFGHECRMQGRSLISTASLGKALTISQTASHVTPLTLPLLMGLASYRLDASWLKDSRKDGEDRPSPMQYAFLQSVLVVTYVFLKFLGFGQTKQQRSFASLPILRRSAFLLIVFLFISYLIAVSDAWLHGTSKVAFLQSTLPYTDSAGQSRQENLGCAVNFTQCDFARLGKSALPFVHASCGLLSSGSGGDAITRMPGVKTLSNSSDLHRVAFADDQTAILVPWDIPSNVSYVSPSVGIKGLRKSITNDCLVPVEFEGQTLYGSTAFLELNCTGRDLFNATTSIIVNALDSTGNPISGYEIEANPFHAGAVVTSEAYSDGTAQQDKFVPNT
ncbi:hypothetical protein BDQ17DRAFT_1426401 [Cyathus striatus]|nr:hypothetical protein BDQ17DRAFT_1426401 [Cyathus striatus]